MVDAGFRDGAGDGDTEGEEIEQVHHPKCKPPAPSGSSRPWAPHALPLGCRGRSPAQPGIVSKAAQGTSQFYPPPTTTT